MFFFSFHYVGNDVQELINAAIKAREYSYSPYSNFKVGAAIRLTDETISTGCNIENAAFSPAVCAERTAAVKAVSQGLREFKAIAIVAYQQEFYTSPCGVCRQFLAEFASNDVPIYLAKPSPLNVLVTKMSSLLPASFGPGERPRDLTLSV